MTNMADFGELVIKCGVNGLFFDGNLNDGRFLCWTRLSSDGASWILAASDGVEIWLTKSEEQDLLTLCKLMTEFENLDDYFDVIKQGFDSSGVTFVKVGDKIIAQFSGLKNHVNIDLFEAKINDKKSEMKYLLFNLADKVKKLEQNLAEQRKCSNEAGKNEADLNSNIQGLGFEPARKSGSGVNLRRKQGSSLVNPNSKRAKRAKGISFE